MASVFEENRQRISLTKLGQFRGQWVAYSSDGSQVLAGAENLVSLREHLTAAGIDPEDVVLGKIPALDDEMPIGGAELL